MAHYLHRHFADDAELHVLHDLRLRDPEQPEQTGEAGTCQIDHLLIHRCGVFIIESKSVTSEIRVRPDGSGGDEWTRVWNNEEKGIASPIRQAKRQGEFLRTYLDRHKEDALGKLPIGTRTLGKILMGSDQRSFKHLPVQLIVAISDAGRIRRLDGWKEPEKPFRVFVAKADLVGEKIIEEVTRHRKAGNPLHDLFALRSGKYGIWEMHANEASAVATLLAENHNEHPRPKSEVQRTDERGAPTKKQSTALNSKEPECKHCCGNDLTALWGKYGYYWKCGTCAKNTAMPTICNACNSIGHRGNKVRIRKKGPRYFRDCQQCQHSEQIWTGT